MRTSALRAPMARFLLRPVKETRVPPSCPPVTALAGVPDVPTASSSLRSTLPPSFPLKAHGLASTDAAELEKIPSPSFAVAQLFPWLLQNNEISGHIPTAIGKLDKLQTLDLSNNQFNGEIPSSLGGLRNLNYLDLSFNNLSGSLPNISAGTFNIIGNHLICGSRSQTNCSAVSLDPLSFPPDDLGTQSQPRGAKNCKVAVTFGASVGSVAVVMIGVGLFLWWRHRHHQQIFFDVNDQYDLEVRLGHLRRFSFKELRVATDKFGCSSQSPEALWILYNRE